MHEYSMTLQIVDMVLQAARKHQASKVSEVSLLIGKLTFLNPSQIRFCYRILVEGTMMKKSRLKINMKEGKVKCIHCSYIGPLKHRNSPTYHIVFPMLECPKCGNAVELIEGKECTVERIRMVKEE